MTKILLLILCIRTCMSILCIVCSTYSGHYNCSDKFLDKQHFTKQCRSDEDVCVKFSVLHPKTYAPTGAVVRSCGKSGDRYSPYFAYRTFIPNSGECALKKGGPYIVQRPLHICSCSHDGSNDEDTSKYCKRRKKKIMNSLI
ncbi:hypothetical protein SNEBB_007910 [Seison nebaliae]|nr:hypothetical protein SNEBB_007910 [Seison nebaliae]